MLTVSCGQVKQLRRQKVHEALIAQLEERMAVVELLSGSIVVVFDVLSAASEELSGDPELLGLESPSTENNRVGGRGKPPNEEASGGARIGEAAKIPKVGDNIQVKYVPLR